MKVKIHEFTSNSSDKVLFVINKEDAAEYLMGLKFRIIEMCKLNEEYKEAILRDYGGGTYSFDRADVICDMDLDSYETVLFFVKKTLDIYPELKNDILRLIRKDV